MTFPKFLSMAIVIFCMVGILIVLFALFTPLVRERKINEGETHEMIEETISAALESKKCQNMPNILPSEISGAYSGLMIDTHIHIASIPDGPVPENEPRPLMGINVRVADYICMMEAEGTAKVFAFFPVWEPIVSEQIEIIQQSVKQYPEKFVPFIMPPDRDDRPDGYPTVDADTLYAMLNVKPDLFQGFGEIGLYARGDHGGPKGAPALPPDSNRLREIYPLIQSNSLLVYFHLGEGQQESFEKVLVEYPNINFIWHGDQLITGSGRNQDLSKIEDILNRHPNAFYGVDELYGDIWLLKPEVSKEQFLAHFKNEDPLIEQDLATWQRFIERHQDQVLWGTDRGWSASWTLDEEVAFVLNSYTRKFIGRLPQEVQEKFAYKNAEKLISGFIE